MIITENELGNLLGETTMVAGGFDPLHEGHIEYFEEAAKFGHPLICSIDSDQYVASKHKPLLKQEQRARIIDAIGCVEYTFLNKGTTADALRKIQPKVFIKGDDWKGRLPQEEKEICQELSVEIFYVDSIRNSSSKLLKNMCSNNEDFLPRFENLVLSQLMPSSNAYDENYFQGSWRKENNEYTLSSRRRIEGKHPEYIKKVFNPTKVLDMGCGPGILMHLLHEIGVKVDGVDISESSKYIASSEVRDNIIIGSVVDIDLGENLYDLVICREVLEHLPVIDVNLAVQNMCRISSRYIYVTTRFHPEPESLLDVTNEFHVDPTHITLMNKDLLRVMFVLYGFKRRKDMENDIDWLNKKRVLVYEKIR